MRVENLDIDCSYKDTNPAIQLHFEFVVYCKHYNANTAIYRSASATQKIKLFVFIYFEIV